MNLIENMQVGKMCLNFSTEKGFSLDYGGASIFKESTLYVVKPGWIAVYYNYGIGEKNVTFNQLPDGKEAVITHKTNSFEGEQKITLRENQLTFEFSYKLLEDVHDAGIEYNLGNISASLITGCKYQVETTEGTESGTIPLKAISTGWDGYVTKNNFKKISLETRIGTITVEGNGVPGDLSLCDVRGLRVTWAEKTPLFTLDTPRTILKKDEMHRSVITYTIDPAPELARPVFDTKNFPAPVHEIPDLHKTSPRKVVVIPEPQEMKLLEFDFVLSSDTQIVVGEHATQADRIGAESFAEEISELYQIQIPIVKESEATSRNQILIGEAALNAKAAEAANEEGISAPEKEEGYALKVTPHRVIVLGYDPHGTFYGMQTLKQLMKVSADAITLQGCEINDFPSLKFRGVYLYTGNKALPYHQKMIDRILTRFKFNTLVLNCDQIQWNSAPEIRVPFSMSHEDLKKDIQYARDRYLDVFPQVSSLGHMNWMFENGQHLDLAEDPDHPYAYCPSNPKSYEFILKLYDEAIDLFGDELKYFHMGHDEVSSVEAEFPFCDKCKDKSVGDLFIEDTWKIYQHLRDRGLKVMMWGDMLLSPGDAPDSCNQPDPKEAARLRKLLPKDMIIADWHYAPGSPEEFKSLELFQDEGLECVASTWYTPSNLEGFSKAAKNNNSLGLFQTTWAGFDSNEQNVVDDPVQFIAYVLAGEFAWNSGKTGLDKLPYQADEVFYSQWNRVPPKRQCLKGFTVDLNAFYNAKLVNTPQETGWVGMGPNSDLSAAPTGVVRLKDNLYHLASDTRQNSVIRLSSALDTQAAYPETIEISLGRKADSLVFLHTCIWTDTPARNIGSYQVNYEDGSSELIPLIYQKNITAWTDKNTTPEAAVVWESETPDGQSVSLREFVWQNPTPDKTIQSIQLQSATVNAGIALLGLSGIV